MVPDHGQEAYLVFAARSDTGLARAVNEDAHTELELHGGWLFMVADGMGGHRAGDKASRLAVKTLVERFSTAGSGDPAQQLHSALTASHEVILAQQDGKTGRERMGTTAVAMFVRDGEAHYAWIGDSRIYLVRDGELSRITEDHTVERDLERKGMLHAVSADFLVEGHRLSRALGVPGQCEPERGARPLALESGDLLVLCSDGLYRHVPAPDILSVLLAEDPQRATDRLVALANAAGGRDNITVQVIQVGSREDAVEAAAREGQIGSLTMELQSLISADFDVESEPPPPAKTARLAPAQAEAVEDQPDGGDDAVAATPVPVAHPAPGHDSSAPAAYMAAQGEPRGAAVPDRLPDRPPVQRPATVQIAHGDVALQRKIKLLMAAVGVSLAAVVVLTMAVVLLSVVLVLSH